MRQMPPWTYNHSLTHSPRRSLVLDHNYELGSAPLDGLAALTALQVLRL